MIRLKVGYTVTNLLLSAAAVMVSFQGVYLEDKDTLGAKGYEYSEHFPEHLPMSMSNSDSLKTACAGEDLKKVQKLVLTLKFRCARRAQASGTVIGRHRFMRGPM